MRQFARTGTENPALPTAESYIRECLEQGACTRIHFIPVVVRRPVITVHAWIVRNGKDFGSDVENRGKVEGYSNSYPTIDLRKVPGINDMLSISLEAFLMGNLPPEVDVRLTKFFRGVEVYLRPRTRDYFVEDCTLIPMSLYAPNGVPEWLQGIDKLELAGTWSTFIDPLSHERKIIDALLAHEKCCRQIVDGVALIKSTATDIVEAKQLRPSLMTAARELLAQKETEKKE